MTRLVNQLDMFTDIQLSKVHNERPGVSFFGIKYDEDGKLIKAKMRINKALMETVHKNRWNHFKIMKSDALKAVAIIFSNEKCAGNFRPFSYKEGSAYATEGSQYCQIANIAKNLQGKPELPVMMTVVDSDEKRGIFVLR